MNKSPQGQTQRIIAHMITRPGVEINGAELSRIGSGKDAGWCAGFSKRICEAREYLQTRFGQTIPPPRIEYVDGQKQCWYKVTPLDDTQPA